MLIRINERTEYKLLADKTKKVFDKKKSETTLDFYFG